MVYKHQLDYWTPENQNAFYPRTYANLENNTEINRRVQTKYLSNGAYLRLKNIQVGYSLPSAALQKIFIKRLRVFFAGENLLTLDHLPDGLETELTAINSGMGYPFIKKYSFGVNVSF
jgi:hypothetical protein